MAFPTLESFGLSSSESLYITYVKRLLDRVI